MTTGDIVFWETLKDKILRSCLDGLPICFNLSGDFPGHRDAAPLLSCSLFLVFVSISFLAFAHVLNSKEDHIPTRFALQALATVVIPRCSLWPSRYIKFASVLRSHIGIPLEVIIRDTVDGIIEFRNPSDDLADLISTGAMVNGHTIHITLGWHWWVRCFKWWLFTQSKSDCLPLRSPLLGLSDWLLHNMSTVNLSPQDLSPRPFASTRYPLLCLDCLSHGIIPTLTVGRTVTVEFTAFSSSCRTLSTAQIFSTIPFMISGRPHYRPRTLVSALKQLNTPYRPDMIIHSISNVSVNYEHALGHMYKSLSENQKVRETWVKILGMEAWRREMFLVALEAALVRRGWIERWAVQVTFR